MRAVVAWCALTGAAAWSANGHMVCTNKPSRFLVAENSARFNSARLQLTAYIAQQRLTPAAAQAADELVAVRIDTAHAFF